MKNHPQPQPPEQGNTKKMANQTNQSLKSNNPSSQPPPTASSVGGGGAVSTATPSSSSSQLVATAAASLGGGGVGQRPTSLGRPPPLGRAASRAASTGGGGFGSSSAVGMRQVFKKCKSATFQIDGHTYTIGEWGGVMGWRSINTVEILLKIRLIFFVNFVINTLWKNAWSKFNSKKHSKISNCATESSICMYREKCSFLVWELERAYFEVKARLSKMNALLRWVGGFAIEFQAGSINGQERAPS